MENNGIASRHNWSDRHIASGLNFPLRGLYPSLDLAAVADLLE